MAYPTSVNAPASVPAPDAASQSVDQAMQSAGQSVEDAEKALSNPGQPQAPGF